MYLLALILMSLILDFNFKSNIWIFAINILGIEFFVPNSNIINVPGWSVGYELFFYLLFPFILKIVSKFDFSKSINIISLLLFISLLIQFNNYITSNLPQYIWLFPSFIFGIIFRKLISEKKYFFLFKKYNLLLLFISTSLLYILVQYLDFNFFNNHYSIDLIIAIIITSISTFDEGAIFTKFINRRIFILAGEISYSIYILQVPVFTLLAQHNSNRPRIDFLVFFISLNIISYFTYTIIEKPVNSKGTKFLIGLLNL